jgi:putative SOS response-associated peptidase YedK
MSITKESLCRQWGALITEEEAVDYYCASGFNHPAWPVICAETPDRIEFPHWGLIPSWVKNDEQATAIRRSTLNARAETLFRKPSFRGSIGKKRCLVLVDGFFEPHKHEGRSYPFYCSMRDRSAFAVAGLYSSWKNPRDGSTRKTFSLITTTSNKLMTLVHNEKRRMPAILRKSEEPLWLDSTLDRAAIEAIVATKEISNLTAHPVSRAVSTRNPDTFNPATQIHVDYPELAHLGLT